MGWEVERRWWDERVAMVTNGSWCSRDVREREVGDAGPKEKVIM